VASTTAASNYEAPTDCDGAVVCERLRCVVLCVCVYVCMYCYARVAFLIVGTVQYSTVQYSTVQYSTVQYSTVQDSTVQYSTVQYMHHDRHVLKR
jgi:hypothetical protein